MAGAVDYTNGYGYLIGNSLGSQSIATNYRTAPSTPYNITARMPFEASGILASILYGGSITKGIIGGNFLGFRDSAGKYMGISALGVVNDHGYLVVKVFSDPNTLSTTLVGNTDDTLIVPTLVFMRDLVLRITNDGTDLYFKVSIDGQTSYTLYSEAITAHLADAANVCWGAIKEDNSSVVMLYDWTVS